jgi:hypothetical protein
VLYFIFLTGPIAIFLSFRYWKAPSSLIPRNKWRFIVATLLGMVHIAAVVLVVVLLVSASRTGRRH